MTKMLQYKSSSETKAEGKHKLRESTSCGNANVAMQTVIQKHVPSICGPLFCGNGVVVFRCGTDIAMHIVAFIKFMVHPITQWYQSSDLLLHRNDTSTQKTKV